MKQFFFGMTQGLQGKLSPPMKLRRISFVSLSTNVFAEKIATRNRSILDSRGYCNRLCFKQFQ